MRGPLWNTSFLSCHGSRGPWILATPSNPASWRRRGRSEVAAEPQGPRAVAAAWKPGQRLAAPDSDPAKLEECAPGAICSASWFYDQSPEGERMSSFARPPPLRGAGSVRPVPGPAASAAPPGAPRAWDAGGGGPRLGPSLPHLSLRGAVNAFRLPAPCPGLGWAGEACGREVTPPGPVSEPGTRKALPRTGQVGAGNWPQMIPASLCPPDVPLEVLEHFRIAPKPPAGWTAVPRGQTESGKQRHFRDARRTRGPAGPFRCHLGLSPAGSRHRRCCHSGCPGPRPRLRDWLCPMSHGFVLRPRMLRGFHTAVLSAAPRPPSAAEV